MGPHHMQNDGPPDDSGKPKLSPGTVSALPAQLGQKLRTLFQDVEAEPIPDRLRELMDALAAKEKKPE